MMRVKINSIINILVISFCFPYKPDCGTMVQNWDSLYIYCFSGTGNALASSPWIAGEANKLGIKAIVQQIDLKGNLHFPEKNERVLIGFAYPTHGFNAAPILIRFVAGFPAGLGKEVFLLNTRAGLKFSKFYIQGVSGLALIVPALILWLKGYKCIGFRPVDLPSNWISLHPGLKKKSVDSIIERCEGIVRKFAVKLFSGEKVWRGLYSLPADLLISPIALGYYIGGRYFLSKTFFATNNCDNCGLCIKECPTSSIKLVNNRPYWKLTCESCMRCMNSCPKKAIGAAHGMAAGFVFLITAVNSGLIMLLLSSFCLHPDIWWWKLLSRVLGILLLITVPAAVYIITHIAMGFKPFHYLVKYTSFTTLPFWRRYRFPPGGTGAEGMQR